jgi:hypothetical protein
MHIHDAVVGALHRHEPITAEDPRLPPIANEARTAVAMAMCSVCPVARRCLLLALGAEPAGGRVHMRYGIYAGTTPQDRTGHSVDDVDELLAFARRRAVQRGLAPTWVAA